MRWEYAIKVVSYATMQAALDLHGAGRWELVQVLRQGDSEYYTMFFKRPIV